MPVLIFPCWTRDFSLAERLPKREGESSIRACGVLGVQLAKSVAATARMKVGAGSFIGVLQD
jgi:hypothetical protein